MRRMKRVLGMGLMLVVAGLITAACSGGADATSEGGIVAKAKEEGKLVVGVKIDQPGLGLKTPDGTYKGFDIDVAKYVAKELGVDAKDIEFKEAPTPERENLLKRGDVDFIVATYSITDERAKVVDFAGPYFLAHQDLLVRADQKNLSEAELRESRLKLCSVTGSTSAQNVKNDFAPQADLAERNGYSECLSGLEKNQVDALTTDDTILAGYAAQDVHRGKFKLAGLNLSNENYGIGLKKGDSEGVAAINAAIEKMIDVGAWKAAVERHLGLAGYETPKPPKIGEVK